MNGLERSAENIFELQFLPFAVFCTSPQFYFLTPTQLTIGTIVHPILLVQAYSSADTPSLCSA